MSPKESFDSFVTVSSMSYSFRSPAALFSFCVCAGFVSFVPNLILFVAETLVQV